MARLLALLKLPLIGMQSNPNANFDHQGAVDLTRVGL